MDRFKRFAIFAVPDGAFLDAGAQWLGWDSVAGVERAHPQVAGLPTPTEALTRTPRRYGFHGTIKPPFRLSPGRTAEDLSQALQALCAGIPPVVVPALDVRRKGGFVAIVPPAPVEGLTDLAARTVRDLDPFRAPAPEAELARRRKHGLTVRQEEMLVRWGYPFVMEEFRFHMTLTGRMDHDDAEHVAATLAMYFAPVLPKPYILRSLCLMGEDDAGRFHLIERHNLSG
jgi:putative phosphonate metabolism protein